MSGGSAEAREGLLLEGLTLQVGPSWTWTSGADVEQSWRGSQRTRTLGCRPHHDTIHTHPAAFPPGRALTLSLKLHLAGAWSTKGRVRRLSTLHFQAQPTPKTVRQWPTVLPRALAGPQAGGHGNGEKSPGWARTLAGSAAMVLCDLRHFITLSEPQ